MQKSHIETFINSHVEANQSCHSPDKREREGENNEKGELPTSLIDLWLWVLLLENMQQHIKPHNEPQKGTLQRLYSRAVEAEGEGGWGGACRRPWVNRCDQLRSLQ